MSVALIKSEILKLMLGLLTRHRKALNCKKSNRSLCLDMMGQHLGLD